MLSLPKYILTLAIVSSSAMHPSYLIADAKTDGVTTETQELIPALQAYYSELNKQLNKHIKNRELEPFSDPFTSNNQDQFKFTPQSKLTNLSPSSSPTTDSTYKANRNALLPNMSFKGMTQNGETKHALLEIEGLGTFVVQENDKVGLKQVNSSGAVLHILEINELNIVVETGSYSQKLVVQ